MLLGCDDAVVSSVYLPTRGRPVDVLREGLDILRERFRGGLEVLGCGATGSGRYLAARLLGADVVKNEITCQMLGARRFIPGVESIFEIGGQDSKFIAVQDSGIADFVMNKICAAGTGSFLEEQARELGIDIYSDFAPLAFGSEAPLDLGSRCTVFMETEVINAVRHGAPAGAICAGLSYAIVKNYLNKVVGNRPLDSTIVLQGGVASNDAVVAAFENIIGAPVCVHPCARPGSQGTANGPAAHVPASPAEVRIPYFADHAYAFSGLWKYKGHNADVLPLPDDRIRILGEKHSLGKECHAYSMLVGDLVDVAAREPGREIVFFFPGTAIPCLLHQYGAGMQVLLRELGIHFLKVSSPTGEELINAFGSDGIERFYMGLLAIELCVKAVCEIRPYEKVRGTADMVHRGNLLRIETAIAAGDIVQALDESLHALSLIPAERNGGRPVVGIAGDLYTKVNSAANNDLYRWLEDRGLEVWPSMFQIDLLDFGISRRLFESVSRGRMQDFLVSGSVAIKRLVDVWKIHRVAAPRVSRLEEPGYLEMKKLAAPYMPNEAHQLLFLNTVKIVDFARRGADGIINAVCFNCMVGNASAAIIEKIRNDYHDIPILTAVYSGGEDPSRAMVLEAFVSQVKRHYARTQLPQQRRSPALWIP